MRLLEWVCVSAFALVVIALLARRPVTGFLRRRSALRVLRPGASVHYYVRVPNGCWEQIGECVVIENNGGEYVRVVWGDGKLGYEKTDGFWESADLIRVWNGDELTEGGLMV